MIIVGVDPNFYKEKTLQFSPTFKKVSDKVVNVDFPVKEVASYGDQTLKVTPLIPAAIKPGLTPVEIIPGKEIPIVDVPLRTIQPVVEIVPVFNILPLAVIVAALLFLGR